RHPGPRGRRRHQGRQAGIGDLLGQDLAPRRPLHDLLGHQRLRGLLRQQNHGLRQRPERDRLEGPRVRRRLPESHRHRRPGRARRTAPRAAEDRVRTIRLPAVGHGRRHRPRPLRRSRTAHPARLRPGPAREGVAGDLTARPVALLARAGLVLLKRSALLFVLLAVVFLGVEILPGDAAHSIAERGETAADLARRRELLGLGRPLPERFWDWISGLPAGALGTSARGEQVTDLVSAAFPNTLLLGGVALLLTTVLSLTLGCWAALRPDGRLDRVVSGASTAAFAIPEFVVAVALVLVLSLWTGWLPAVTLTDAGGAPASWTMLILPALALTIPQTGWNTTVVRAALADEARAPHVETAVLDGLPPRRVLTHHVLPGALPTIAT